jgi:hypothetical protein
LAFFGGQGILLGLSLSIGSFRFRLLRRERGPFRVRRPHSLPGADRHACDEEQSDRRRRRQCGPVFLRELPQPIRRRRRTRFYWLVAQIALNVSRHAVGGLVPPRTILLQRLHRDPVEIAANELG